MEQNKEKLDAELNNTALSSEIKGIFHRIISIKEAEKQKYQYE